MGYFRCALNRTKTIKKVALALALVTLGMAPWGTVSAATRAVESPSNYVTNGKYVLKTTAGKYLAVDGGNVYISDWGGAARHEVTLTRNNQGYYAIRSVATGRVLDIAGGSMASGANVQTWNWNGTCAQKFALDLVDKDYYNIKSSCRMSNVLDVAGGAVGSSGANVWSYAGNGTAAQKWELVARGASGPSNGTYKLLTKRSRALDVTGGYTFSGVNVQTYWDNNTGAQEWRLTRNSDGSYQVMNPQSGKMLDVKSASRQPKANVWLWTSNYTCAQRWFIERQADGYYTLMNGCGGTALDIAGGESSWEPIKNVQMWTPNGTDAQKWYLAKK